VGGQVDEVGVQLPVGPNQKQKSHHHGGIFVFGLWFVR